MTPLRATLVALAAALVLALAGCGGDDGPRGAGPEGEFHPVAGNFEPDDTSFDDCTGDARCLEQAFGNLTYEEGPKPALALFERRMREDRAVESGCHRIVHTIGSAALARYEGNVARAFSEGSAACWSGYYHGILERAFASAKTKAELGSVARELCEDEGVRADTFIAYQCVHGLGHGLMIQSGYDLPLSLELCDALRTEWDQTSCTGGVFMENISSSYGFTSKWLKKDDPVYPCNEVDPRHKTYCYLMVTSRILQENGYDFAAAARTCSTVERGWGHLCYQSLGRDASGYTRQDPQRIDELCDLAGERGRSDCVYGAARDITSNDAHGRRAVRLCATVGEANRARCFEGVGTIVGTLEATAEERIAACRALTTRHARDCTRGAGVAAA